MECRSFNEAIQAEAAPLTAISKAIRGLAAVGSSQIPTPLSQQKQCRDLSGLFRSKNTVAPLAVFRVLPAFFELTEVKNDDRAFSMTFALLVSSTCKG